MTNMARGVTERRVKNERKRETEKFSDKGKWKRDRDGGHRC